MTDPRAGDVAQAERLVAEARHEGVVRLPVLSAGELWVLCGDRQVLADEAESRWWAGLTDERRATLAAAVMDFMTERGLLRRDGEPSRSMTPELGLVVAARQYPAVVVVCGLADGSVQDAPRLYGLADGDRPAEVLVFETISRQVTEPFGPLHHFSLLSANRAAHTLALWATEHASGKGLLGKLGSKGPQRIVDLYRSKPGEQLGRDRVLVGPARDRRHEVLVGARSTAPAEPAAFCDFDEVAGLLRTMLADEPI